MIKKKIVKTREMRIKTASEENKSTKKTMKHFAEDQSSNQICKTCSLNKKRINMEA